MDGKKKLNPRSGGGRTPQPPARDSSGGGTGSSKPPPQLRSRTSTPTATDDGDSPAVVSPTAAGIMSTRASVAPRQPKVASSTSNNNNSNSSPRAIHSTRKPPTDEPATDDDDAANRFLEPPNDEWLRQSEVTLAALEKQVQDAAKRTLKHQSRCTTMKDSMIGKEERMDTLQGTYATLNRALDELELISNGELDSDALEEMYNSIPSDERAAALVHAGEYY